MNVFEVFLIVLILASMVTLATAIGLAIFGRRAIAVRILRRYCILLAIYLTIVLVVSPFSPRRVVHPDQPLCFDDWCITIHGVQQTNSGEFEVSATISSRARRTPQREVGVVLYLADATQRLFDSVPSSSDIPFDIRMQPNESVEVSRTYRLPSGSTPAGVVVAHEGGFPITWFVIGDGPFKKPPIVLFPKANASPPNSHG